MKFQLKSLLSVAIGGFLLLLVGLSVYALTLSETAKLLAGDGAASDLFGESVAVDGDTAVIGAIGDDDTAGNAGAAYVFTRSAGVWTEQQKLIASDGAATDTFGISVAVHGDTAVIGAFFDDDNGSNAGAAYVFTRSGTTWTEQAKLIASDGATDDHFGVSVAVNGDTAVIGADLDDDDGVNSGSAYVFTRSGTSWTEQAKLTASDAVLLDQFGFSVALAGDTAVIGAPFDDDNGGLSGSAYVFARSGTAWSQQAKLTASDGTNSDFFGISVAVDADSAVIGASGDDDKGTGSGSAYLFSRSGTTWTETAKLIASDGGSLDEFGRPVSVSGSTAVVGARLDDDQGSDSGSAYVFDLTSAMGTQTQIAKLRASDGAAFDRFGISTAVSGNTALVGAIDDDDQGTSSGSAYVFDLFSGTGGPITSNTVATPNPVAVNTGTTLTANVNDITTGGSNIASADYTIDGGTLITMAAQDGAFDEISENVTAAVSAFPEANVHQLCVSGTDAEGNRGGEDCTLLAVYDPSAGFVTGGGWINSPSNACHLTPECEGLSGKANFGFVSKYQQSAQTPTGNTKFVFKVGDLKFDSDSYEWLVVANHRAQYKGVGTINSSGNYGFMLFAIDADLTPSTDVDLFRIKIWDKDNGDMVVYDNELGSGEDADPMTEIGGGSIVIHASGS
jgi:hypothetical protein